MSRIRKRRTILVDYERAYANGQALNSASYFELDDVIDPAASRRWITAAFDDWTPPARTAKKRSCIDTW